MLEIAVHFPGIGYHCDKPLLYYSRNCACELGYKDYKNVSYTYNAGNIRGNEKKMKDAYEALLSQTEAALTDIYWSGYDDALFISKSIGTIIAASYAEKYGLGKARQRCSSYRPHLPLCRVIYFPDSPFSLNYIHFNSEVFPLPFSQIITIHPAKSQCLCVIYREIGV